MPGAKYKEDSKFFFSERESSRQPTGGARRGATKGTVAAQTTPSVSKPPVGRCIATRAQAHQKCRGVREVAWNQIGLMLWAPAFGPASSIAGGRSEEVMGARRPRTKIDSLTEKKKC